MGGRNSSPAAQGSLKSSIEQQIEDGHYWMVFKGMEDEEAILCTLTGSHVQVIGSEDYFAKDKCILLAQIFPPVFDN